ncbi:MAG: PQQ-binding-like beta-propeller repeat protein [Planctomycetota bacterium]
MTGHVRNAAALLLPWFLLTAGSAAANPSEPGDWPRFRGVSGTGVADGFPTAVKWDATDPDDPAILWNVAVPGLGHSSPVIVGDRLFLLTAVPADGEASLILGRNGNIDAAEEDEVEQTWLVLCYDKTTGEERWRRTARTGVPRATRHAKASHANTSVAVAGDRLVVFLGSEGLYCYDLEGTPLWERDLGVVDVRSHGAGWGYASSPAVADGRIVLLCDAPADPYLAAFSLEDGKELWRVSRTEVCERSWGAPLIHPPEDATTGETSCGVTPDRQIVVNGWPWIVSYDLATGEERWRVRGGGDLPVPSPFAAEGRFFMTNAHGGPSPLIAVNHDAFGDLSAGEDKQEDAPAADGKTDADAETSGEEELSEEKERKTMADGGPTETDGELEDGAFGTGEENEESAERTPGPGAGLAWRTERGGSYLSTPVVYDGRLYVGATNGVFRCFDAETGQRLYQERLPGAYVVASLVAADGKIYCPAEDGTVYVIAATGEFELLAENPLGGACLASPAISAGVIYFHTVDRLIAVRPALPGAAAGPIAAENDRAEPEPASFAATPVSVEPQN